MDLRKLGYFIEVADQGSITKAAGALRMTQPALSRQIRAFEDEMGWPLLDRGAKSIRLTRQGQVVLSEGRRIRKAVDNAMARMQREIEGAVIRIGYAPSLGGKLLKEAMGCFVQRHEDARIELRDLSSEEMLRQLEAGDLDLMIGVRSERKGFAWQDLDRKRLMMAVPKKHPLANKRAIKAEELEGQRLLLLSRHDYPEYWEGVTTYFQAHDINAKVAGEFDGIESLRVALEAGVGIAMVAETSEVGKEVKRVHMKPEPQGVRVAVGWRDDRALDPVTSAFVEELRITSSA